VRLVRRVERLEDVAAAGAAKALAPERYVVWSKDDLRADASQLGPGDLIAADVTFHPSTSAALGGAPRDYFPWGHGAVVVAERITRDPDDLGLVYDASAVEGELVDGWRKHAVVGRVVDMDGVCLTVEFDSGAIERVTLPGPGAIDER
jgi:hypothetical protein